jgi:hypothetical protein
MRSNINNKITISLKEIIKISRDNKKLKVLADTDKKMDSFVNSYEIIKTNKHSNISVNEILNNKRSILKDISKELGINLNELCNKLGIKQH